MNYTHDVIIRRKTGGLNDKLSHRFFREELLRRRRFASRGKYISDLYKEKTQNAMLDKLLARARAHVSRVRLFYVIVCTYVAENAHAMIHA